MPVLFPWLLLFSYLLLISSVVVNAQQQQQQQSASSCNDIYDCNECLNQPNAACVFAVGACQSVCTEDPQSGATCYSSATYTDVVNPNSICDLYNSDNARCTNQKSCAGCVATIKSDGKSCQWYASAQACFGGGTGPFGSGELQCPTATQPTGPGPAPAPTTTTAPAPTLPPPAPTPGPTPTPAPQPAPATAAPQPQPTTMAPTQVTLMDQANCQVQTDCASCTSTLLTNGNGATCFWFPDTGECDSSFNGNGILQCPETTTTTPPVVPEESICQQTDGCSACLEANCAWSPDATSASYGDGNCAPSCSDFPADDADCYSMITNTDTEMTSTAMCEIATNNLADRELCFAQMDCASCTATVKSDGINTCRWYTDTTTGVEWCQTGHGCDRNGVCGSDTCDATTDAPGTDGSDSSTTNGGTTDATTAPPTTPTTTTDCTDFDQFGANGCVPCLSSPNNCAWVLETCVPNCDDIANGGDCYSTTAYPNTTPETICQQAASSANGGEAAATPEDIALCGSKNYCFTCTSTIKSDGSETCSWYSNPTTGEEWCGVGGCDPYRENICGSPDEAVCQQPQEDDDAATADDASSTTTTTTDAATGQSSSDNSSTSSERRKLISSLLLGFVLVASQLGLF